MGEQAYYYYVCACHRHQPEFCMNIVHWKHRIASYHINFNATSGSFFDRCVCMRVFVSNFISQLFYCQYNRFEGEWNVFGAHYFSYSFLVSFFPPTKWEDDDDGGDDNDNMHDIHNFISRTISQKILIHMNIISSFPEQKEKVNVKNRWIKVKKPDMRKVNIVILLKNCINTAEYGSKFLVESQKLNFSIRPPTTVIIKCTTKLSWKTLGMVSKF